MSSSNSSSILGELIATLLVAVFIGIFCHLSDRDLHEILEAQGYTDVVPVHGYAQHRCSDDDTYAALFTATTPAGARVSGAVCCGALTKGCTTRIDHVITPAPPHQKPTD